MAQMLCPECGSKELEANTWEAWCNDCDQQWTRREQPEVYAKIRGAELDRREELGAAFAKAVVFPSGPQPMAPAKFKTLCEAMGYTAALAAEQFGVTARNVQRWQSGAVPVPYGISEEIKNLWDEWTGQIGQILDQVEAAAALNGDPESIDFARPHGSTGDDALRTAKASALAIMLGVQGLEFNIDYETDQ